MHKIVEGILQSCSLSLLRNQPEIPNFPFNPVFSETVMFRRVSILIFLKKKNKTK